MSRKNKNRTLTPQQRLDGAVKELRALLERWEVSIICDELRIVNGMLMPQVRLAVPTPQPVPQQPTVITPTN